MRTIAVDNAQSVTYTATQQSADLGATQSVVNWVVYQMSTTFGRGAPGLGGVLNTYELQLTNMLDALHVHVNTNWPNT